VSQKKPEVCALCQQPKPLADSHLVPGFLLRAAASEIRTGKRAGKRETSIVNFGKNQSVDIQVGSFERKQGLVKKLLCSDCEQKIGKWETYARLVLYGNEPGPDIKKRDLGESVLGLLGPRYPEAFKDLREVKVDYSKFKLFELSLLWRAGLENKSWGKTVHLGPFQEDLRQHLLNDDPGAPLYLPAIVVDYRDDIVNFEGIIPSVELLQRQPFHSYRVTLGGYGWFFSVSKNAVQSVAPLLSLQHDGGLRILVAEGRPVTERFAQLFQQLRD
jgi:hypothetical protein